MRTVNWVTGPSFRGRQSHANSLDGLSEREHALARSIALPFAPADAASVLRILATARTCIAEGRIVGGRLDLSAKADTV